MKTMYRVALAAGAAVLALSPASGSHSWGTYHWATDGHGVDATVVYSITPQWTNYVNGAVSDWDKSKKLSLNTASGDASDLGRRLCEPILGKVRVCNQAYGQRPWVGLATIWLSNGHIVQAVTQLNDSYFDTYAFYNTPAWRTFVACQEIGHDWGLDHQDENFDNVNLGSCMDYTRAPQGGVYNGFDYGASNEHPNAHDYEQLLTIYGHNDGYASTAATNFGVRQIGRSPISSAPAGTSPAEWGTAVRKDGQGRPNVFVKDLGGGQRMLTHVLWAVDAKVR